MLSNNISFNISDFFTGVENNNLNFNKFVINYKAISHKSYLNISKKLSDIKDLFIKYEVNEFVDKQTSKKGYIKLQTLYSLIHMHLTKIIVRKNDNNRDKNKKSYSFFQISELITITINFHLLSH